MSETDRESASGPVRESDVEHSKSTKVLDIASILLLMAIVAFFAVGLLDEDFRKIVTKPDNVPIAGMLFLVGFFTWLSLHEALKNDPIVEQREREEKALSKNGREDAKKVKKPRPEKVETWPNLVYIELVCMVLVSVLLLVWSITIDAPLEEMANPTKTPNPAKAPWYFLGLQEMLVYFDPWIAGVILPTLIIVGLMAIPYLDINPLSGGYYAWRNHKYAITVFLFGFLVLWVILIIVGTFLRGPGWNFFSPFEEWDLEKVVPLNNVNLSEFFGMNPKTPWFIREAIGFVILGAYFLLTPGIVFVMRDFFDRVGFLRLGVGLLLALLLVGVALWALSETWYDRYFIIAPFFLVMAIACFSVRNLAPKMGVVRYVVMMELLLIMLILPIKMVLRWSVNLKYFVVTPWFNI